MKKYIILLLLGFSYSYNLNTYFTNYFTNLTELEKETIKNYGYYYPNEFIIINMLL